MNVLISSTSELISKLAITVTFFQQGISEREFYGDLVYKLKRGLGRADYSY